MNRARQWPANRCSPRGFAGPIFKRDDEVVSGGEDEAITGGGRERRGELYFPTHVPGFEIDRDQLAGFQWHVGRAVIEACWCDGRALERTAPARIERDDMLGGINFGDRVAGLAGSYCDSDAKNYDDREANRRSIARVKTTYVVV